MFAYLVTVLDSMTSTEEKKQEERTITEMILNSKYKLVSFLIGWDTVCQF